MFWTKVSKRDMHLLYPLFKIESMYKYKELIY